MVTWHATARTLPHAHSSIWRLQGFGVGFRGGASGWGFGVGFRGFGVSGWGPDDMRPAWKRGRPQQGHFHMHSPLFGDFRVSVWGFLENTGCYQNTQNKPGSPWRTLVAIHNFVASAFLHYKISTQKCFRPC